MSKAAGQQSQLSKHSTLIVVSKLSGYMAKSPHTWAEKADGARASQADSAS